MKAMELFDPTKDLRKLFSDNDVCHIRIQYANSLFFHRGNKVDQNVVTSFFDLLPPGDTAPPQLAALG
jgi:hypothetical protein